mgnify:CR=1 FL=1
MPWTSYSIMTISRPLLPFVGRQGDFIVNDPNAISCPSLCTLAPFFLFLFLSSILLHLLFIIYISRPYHICVHWFRLAFCELHGLALSLSQCSLKGINQSINQSIIQYTYPWIIIFDGFFSGASMHFRNKSQRVV